MRGRRSARSTASAARALASSSPSAEPPAGALRAADGRPCLRELYSRGPAYRFMQRLHGVSYSPLVFVRRGGSMRGRPTKYIFVTGGVLSSLGKGIASASIGALLEARGLRVS